MNLLRFAGAALAAALLAVPAMAADKDNTPPEGFTALFNGKDLTGWQGVVPINQRGKGNANAAEKRQKVANTKVLPHWTVIDGILTYDGKGDSLQSAKDFADFELHVSWKIGKGGDSGLYLRGNPQVQIWDSENLSESLKADWHTGSGGLWNNPAPPGTDPKKIGKTPLKKADKPVGEWNEFKIVMKGDKVTIHLNDELVVDDAALANYWEKGKPLPATGPIELQHHGDKLWFKNIYVKELK